MDYSLDRMESAHVLRWLPPGVEVEIRKTADGDAVPGVGDIGSFDRVIHTGSALSIIDDPPFLEEAMELIRRAAGAGMPQFGICYGHQLLFRALQGREAVERCPEGPETGWLGLQLGDAGAGLLADPGSPGTSSMRVFQSHRDRVIRVTPGCELLAWSEHTRLQAVLDRDLALLGVQFHPEFDRESGRLELLSDPEFVEREGRNAESLAGSGPEDFSACVFFERFVLDRLPLTGALRVGEERSP